MPWMYRAAMPSYPIRQGTINSWIFVNGELTEEAFIQCIMTATEAKVKVMHELEIKDPETEHLQPALQQTAF